MLIEKDLPLLCHLGRRPRCCPPNLTLPRNIRYVQLTSPLNPRMTSFCIRVRHPHSIPRNIHIAHTPPVLSSPRPYPRLHPRTSPRHRPARRIRRASHRLLPRARAHSRHRVHHNAHRARSINDRADRHARCAPIPARRGARHRVRRAMHRAGRRIPRRFRRAP